MLVSTVTASKRGAPGNMAASAAAASMAGPPPACTVSNSAPVVATERMPPATVFGMSCSFRSRKSCSHATEVPLSEHCRQRSKAPSQP